MMAAKWWNVAVAGNGIMKTVKLCQMMFRQKTVINGIVKTVEIVNLLFIIIILIVIKN